jgi:predicted GNAT family acetyltransferase
MAVGMALAIERFRDPATFLDRVGGFLGEREAEHNLLFGILDALQRHPSGSQEPPYLAAVVDGDRIVAAALRTPPRNVVLSEVDDTTAIKLVVDDLVARGEEPGVVGPAAVARKAAGLWTQATGRPHRLGLHQRVFRLSRVVPARQVEGTMRVAGPADRDLLVAWGRAFNDEALPPDEHAPDPAAVVDAWLTLGTKRLYLWEVDGRPVSWAGVGGRTPNGTRVGPVYTPPEERGRGYASALVAAASQAALDEGLAFCFLFTDLANPTANRIYQAIGYEPVSDVDAYYFD